MKLTEIYNQKCASPSDIYEHLPTLKAYASECTHVTEMGVRTIVSTYALLQGLHDWKGRTFLNGCDASNSMPLYHIDAPKKLKLVSIDLYHPQEHGGNLQEAEDVAREAKVDFEFIKGDTLKIDIEPTDFLFIDTLHIYPQLLAELERHHTKVKKFIALHDTTTFATKGEVEGERGLWFAVEEFLANHKEWMLRQRYTNNNGLTILERVLSTSELKELESDKKDKSGLSDGISADETIESHNALTPKIPVLGIPVLNRGDLLERLVLSIDIPVETLFIVNNGNDEGVWNAIQKIRLGLNPLVESVCVYSECRNIGVATSWTKLPPTHVGGFKATVVK